MQPCNRRVSVLAAQLARHSTVITTDGEPQRYERTELRSQVPRSGRCGVSGRRRKHRVGGTAVDTGVDADHCDAEPIGQWNRARESGK